MYIPQAWLTGRRPRGLSRRGYIIGLVEFAGLLCLGLFLWECWTHFQVYWIVSTWKTAEAKILNTEHYHKKWVSTVHRRFPIYHSVNELRVYFEYEVDGSKYVSERFDLSGGRSENNSRYNRIQFDFPVGRVTRAYYNPDHPSEAVLRPEETPWSRSSLYAGSVSLLIGVWTLWVFIIRRKRRTLSQ